LLLFKVPTTRALGKAPFCKAVSLPSKSGQSLSILFKNETRDKLRREEDVAIKVAKRPTTEVAVPNIAAVGVELLKLLQAPRSTEQHAERRTASCVQQPA
jgi:hypothetical protein